MVEPEPTTWQEFFDMIDEGSTKHAHTSYFLTYIIDRIKQGQQQYPFMQGKTNKDYTEYMIEKEEEEDKREAAVPAPTALQFWRAAYDFDHLRARQNGDLMAMVASGKLKRIPLGQLYGTHLELEVDLGALYSSYVRINEDMGVQRLIFPSAVSFYECHPSEDERMIRVSADKDTLLRRFL